MCCKSLEVAILHLSGGAWITVSCDALHRASYILDGRPTTDEEYRLDDEFED